MSKKLKHYLIKKLGGYTEQFPTPRPNFTVASRTPKNVERIQSMQTLSIGYFEPNIISDVCADLKTRAKVDLALSNTLRDLIKVVEEPSEDGMYLTFRAYLDVLVED